MQAGDLFLPADVLTHIEQLLSERFLSVILSVQRGELISQRIGLMFNLSQALAVGLATQRNVFQQRLFFHPQCADLSLQAGQIFRQRIKAHAHAGGGGIEQVDGFVRQLAAGNVAAGEADGSFDRFVVDVHAVMLRVAGLQAA